MRYRLEAEHYIDDKLLEPGTEIGDGTAFPFRHVKDTPSKDKGGNPVVLKAGSPIPPSVSMVPLDDEAKRIFREEHGTDHPEVDPTKKIPIQGTTAGVKQSPTPIQPKPQGTHPMTQPSAGPQGVVSPNKTIPPKDQ